MEHHAGTLVLGENKRWKQDCDMGSQNNQNFVSMPIGLLKQMIIYKASDAGIKTIMQPVLPTVLPQHVARMETGVLPL